VLKFRTVVRFGISFSGKNWQGVFGELCRNCKNLPVFIEQKIQH